jgi:hypothetical protein
MVKRPIFEVNLKRPKNTSLALPLGWFVRGRQSRIRGYFMLDRPAAATACASVQTNRRAYAAARHTDGFVIGFYQLMLVCTALG